MVSLGEMLRCLHVFSLLHTTHLAQVLKNFLDNEGARVNIDNGGEHALATKEGIKLIKKSILKRARCFVVTTYSPEMTACR